MRIGLIVWLFILTSFTVEAQVDRSQRDPNNIYNRGGVTKDSLPEQESVEPLPEAVYKYAYASDLSKWKIYGDTLLDLFHIYDKARNADTEYYTLGQTGTAARPMAYKIRENIGYDNGLHQYDLYFKSIENFKFFDTNRPLNHLYFSPLDGQQNLIVKTLFSRAFSDGISFNLDYERIRQNGFYSSQENKHTNFAAGIRYYKPESKYELLVNYFSNNFSERYNGGIEDPLDFSVPALSERLNIPTVLNAAEGRYANREFRLLHYIKLLPRGKWNLKLTIENSWMSRYFRFSDEISSDQEQDYYTDIVNDTRGVRAVLNEDMWTNSAVLKLNAGEYLEMTSGIESQYVSYNQENGSQQVNNLFFKASISTKIKKTIGLNCSTKLGLLDATGDFNIDTKADVSINDWLALDGRLYLYRYSPSLSDQSIVISQQSIFNQNLEKPFGSLLDLCLTIPKINTRLSLRQGIEDNSIYRDSTTVAAKQLSGQLTSLQLELHQSLKWWRIGYNGSLLYQTFSNDIYQLPPLVTTQSLYYDSPIFKRKMQLQVGADLRFILFDDAVDFFPVNGQLYAINQSMEDLLSLDAFVNFKVQQFRFFFKVENALDLFQERKNYTLYNYPDYDWAMRLGISWLISD